MKYHIWTIGCQMNVADSQRLASSLERLGFVAADEAKDADVIVLNTCVVRQSAEDKAVGRLTSLKPLKNRPGTVIGLMGCLVGHQDPVSLRRRFPWVDVFLQPSDPAPLLDYLVESGRVDEHRALEVATTAQRLRLHEDDWLLPLQQQGQAVTAFVPVVLGCSHACSYCVIPYRRGPEKSLPADDIVAEVNMLVRQGVKEVTLLGQIVDRYGCDQSLERGVSESRLGNREASPLVGLLRCIHQVEGLERIRFLTSHPLWMTDDLIDAVAELPKVCEHFEVPVQAGNDEVLARMRRGYTVSSYRDLVGRIRGRVPNVSIATDIIVGFPGETKDQFQDTYDLLAELRLDRAHVARYSPRPQTLAKRKFEDDVPEAEKERRRKAVDDLQGQIAAGINAQLLGTRVAVLVEGRKKGRWWGRTRTDKLVFFDDEGNWLGKSLEVHVTWAGPWSLVGDLLGTEHSG